MDSITTDSGKPVEFLRYKSDAWGQRVLEGASWDLIWVFAAAGFAFIVFHAVYTHRKLKRPQNDERNDERHAR